ncbi:MAG TPA: putative glycoside hydrolase [Gaiellaceae bacterium]|nr:putative glycoside hydrolase [Gaiellaceae bacterium]
MVLEPVDPNQLFRDRRRQARRRRRQRRLVLIGVTVAVALGAAVVVWARGDGGAAADAENAALARPAPPATSVAKNLLAPRPAPAKMRGVHVTMALASIPGKLQEYLRMPGLNTLQLDIKDENGEVGFVPSAVPFAAEIGAARRYYKPREVARLARRHGVYLVGRIVCFEDPVLSAARPAMAVQRPDGSRWLNHAGLGWADPYNREVWRYLGDLAVTAVKLGFDEIQFDYVRFPTDGDVEAIRYPSQTSTAPGWVIAEFVHYVSSRVKPLGARVSADVFGLAATRDLGIGQLPRRIARYLDAIYPMVYPSHYGPGEYGLEDPNATPGPTVAAALGDFNRELEGRKTEVIPWLQDFSYGRTYTAAEVREQIDAAASTGAEGFLLWNAAGVYSDDVLTYEPVVAD